MTDKRSGKTMVIALVVLMVACTGLGVAGYLRGSPPSGTSRFYMCSDGGAVLFEHGRHSETVAGCLACHHDLVTDVYECNDCHEDAEYTADMASHDELLDLHDRACDGCHEIASASEAMSCRECHEDDLADVYHQSCSACHLEIAPERFANESGVPVCKSCHLR